MASSQKDEIECKLPPYLLGFSTKSYFSIAQTLHYVSQILSLTHESRVPEIQLFIIPSFPTLPLVSKLISEHANDNVNSLVSAPLWLGAQNCHSAADPGPYTGEVSAAMCAESGCRIVELGHAERRAKPFNEDDDQIAAKASVVVKQGMVPLVCIGEKGDARSQSTLREQELERQDLTSAMIGSAVSECRSQICSVLAAVSATAPVVFAYEPVWAIGASAPASGEYVRAVVSALRVTKEVMERSGDVRWLYGGSAGPGTWKEMGRGRDRNDGVDGLFLGRFAHDVKNFVGCLGEMEV